MSGIYRDYAKAMFKQVFEREIAWSDDIDRGTDHGDGLHGVENAADVGVGVGVVVVHLRQASGLGEPRIEVSAIFPLSGPLVDERGDAFFGVARKDVLHQNLGGIAES